ncbi:MarR family transcriptional regulator [Pleomorphomonas diazotrophica]|uniref:MarR family transcriptional regulator n=1 Tax=Pleomorphomonas diazotrophica TaxID=1166257 RepID=A0A1I4V459_9HYPH|nr:MarR family transcriptional regulator [Pleomorphomonas diazotrophica]PKR87429.1 MarR family transcriptional regulator [Pleomorphomonas diazotrophica]SFM95945.1 DNA-binding transcriptional regulator, MarR family [Pleomorphomonas diazotrophica]
MTADPQPAALEVPRIDDLLCFSIYSAGLAFNQLYRPLLEEIGLTYPQFLVMVALWDRDGRTVKELGEALYLDSSTLTPLLKRLEAVGLLSRSRNPKDERQVLLRVTDKGNALRPKAAAVACAIVDTVGISAEAAKTLRSGLDGIRNKIHRQD